MIATPHREAQAIDARPNAIREFVHVAEIRTDFRLIQLAVLGVYLKAALKLLVADCDLLRRKLEMLNRVARRAPHGRPAVIVEQLLVAT